MSEYDALSQELDSAFERQQAYEEEGREFAGRLVDALRKHIGVPDGRLHVLPTQNAEEGTRCLCSGPVRCSRNSSRAGPITHTVKSW